jgi:hypothetical protein
MSGDPSSPIWSRIDLRIAGFWPHLIPIARRLVRELIGFGRRSIDRTHRTLFLRQNGLASRKPLGSFALSRPFLNLFGLWPDSGMPTQSTQTWRSERPAGSSLCAFRTSKSIVRTKPMRKAGQTASVCPILASSLWRSPGSSVAANLRRPQVPKSNCQRPLRACEAPVVRLRLFCRSLSDW